MNCSILYRTCLALSSLCSLGQSAPHCIAQYIIYRYNTMYRNVHVQYREVLEQIYEFNIKNVHVFKVKFLRSLEYLSDAHQLC